MSEKERYEKLALKWLDGTISADEKDEFAAWYNSHDDSESILPASFVESEQALEARIYARVKYSVAHAEPIATTRKSKKLKWVFPAAAVLLMGLSMGLYVWLSSVDNAERSPYDIAPGSNKAMLTFSDGRSVELSEAQNGIVIADGEIRYQDGEQLVNSQQDGEKGLITMRTPKGGMYRVTLSDGSIVWLNSASSLRYPARFTSAKRVVELEGEGYFDVSRNEEHPFVVKCDGQEIEVLGTAFNVNAYADEGGARTTLVEGKVRLTARGPNLASRILHPGQQASLQDADFTVVDVNTDEFTAWTEGYFHFNDTDMHTVMKRFARWYDIEVTYEGAIENAAYGGRIPMNMPLGSVLNVLKMAGVEYEIKEDRQLVVKGK
ncbi:FecR domain-containing protein [Parapedobacter sp. 2B3]|uniref:FecR domain-containing protein n=1 Tax=Parapedobacter sp. 2B3 TaxID=3342381 RepID=UPI0035B66EE4